MLAPRWLDDEPAPHTQHRKVALPCLGPVLLVNEPCLELANRPQPERLQVAKVVAGALDGVAGVGGRRIRANGHRPRWVDARGQPVVYQIEWCLDRHHPTGGSAQDFAHRLDRFVIGLHRQLDPRAAGAQAVAQLMASFSRSPRPRLRRVGLAVVSVPSRSPDSAANSSSSSFWRADSLLGTRTSTNTCRSPRAPARRRCGTPLPRSRISAPGWVPALISISSWPSAVGTVSRAPSAACVIDSGSS